MVPIPMSQVYKTRQKPQNDTTQTSKHTISAQTLEKKPNNIRYLGDGAAAHLQTSMQPVEQPGYVNWVMQRWGHAGRDLIPDPPTPRPTFFCPFSSYMLVQHPN